MHIFCGKVSVTFSKCSRDLCTESFENNEYIILLICKNSEKNATKTLAALNEPDRDRPLGMKGGRDQVRKKQAKNGGMRACPGGSIL